ncbi:hypothetical protein Taro_033997 [Colocasia esculenta]|uniref:Uncharacterized protein n=1 Tax=Colocasia esculenta TaxID=4460 RepID=A0A843WAL2_COLES|nr:hypothetical protein [Colocasia esculenta]
MNRRERRDSRVNVLGYNRLVDHVGIHDQRRLTEALNKDSLVRRKEYPMESSSKSRKSRRTLVRVATGSTEIVTGAFTGRDRLSLVEQQIATEALLR